MIDKNFIKRKLKLMAEDLGHLEEFGDYNLSELAKDFMKHAAVERILERIVIRATDINNHLIAELGKGVEKVRGYRDGFLRLADLGVYSQDFSEKMGDNARFRNILVHEYNNIEPELIHKKVREVLENFRQYSNYILKFIEK